MTCYYRAAHVQQYGAHLNSEMADGTKAPLMAYSTKAF